MALRCLRHHRFYRSMLEAMSRLDLLEDPRPAKPAMGTDRT